MRALAVLALLGGVAYAGKPDAAIEKLVRQAVEADQRWDGAIHADGALLVLPTGDVGELTAAGAAIYKDWGNGLRVTQQVTKLTIGSKTTVNGTPYAWFQGQLEIQKHTTVHLGDEVLANGLMRVGGLAIDDHGWKIAALMISDLVPDSTLALRATKQGIKLPARRWTPDPNGTSNFELDIARWFDKGFAGFNLTGAMVSGTSQDEVATGADVGKLVAAWDKLKLVPTEVHIHSFAKGYLSFVRAKVMMPIKAGAAPLALGAVVVADGTYWQWTSLQYSQALPR